MNFREFAPRIKPGRRVPCVLKNPIYMVAPRNLSAREKTTRNGWKIIFSRSEFSVIWLGKNKLHLFIFIEEHYTKIDAVTNVTDKYNFRDTYFRGWKHDIANKNRSESFENTNIRLGIDISSRRDALNCA